MKRKATIIFILIFTNSFCQETLFKEVTKIIEYNEQILDTLMIEKWNTFDEKTKIKLRLYTINRNNRINRDSSSIAKVIFFGYSEKIRIVSNEIDTTFNKLNQSFNYQHKEKDFSITKGKIYELISYERNSGIKEITIYFIDSKRKANLRIDTKFTHIFIYPNFNTIIKEVELNSNLTTKGELTSEKGNTGKPEDEIIIEHEYAK